MDLSKYSIEELESLEKKYTQELFELNEEYKIAKATVIKSNKTNILADSSDEETDFKFKKTKNKQNKNTLLVQKIKKNLYGIITGIRIIDISIRCPTIDEEPEIVNRQMYLYEVNANIEKLTFNLKYLSNQEPDTLMNSDFVTALIYKLEIQITSSEHKAELNEITTYFSEHPSYFGSLFIYLKKYYDLYNLRHSVIKQLIIEFKPYLTIARSETNGSYVISCHGQYYSPDIFHLKWMITRNPETITAFDDIVVEVGKSDDIFVSDTQILFEKICNDTEISHTEKLEILKRIMISVKDADTRFTAMSSTN